MGHLRDLGAPARIRARRRPPARSGAGPGPGTVIASPARTTVTSRGAGGRSAARVRAQPRSPGGGQDPGRGQEDAKHPEGRGPDLAREGAPGLAAETGGDPDLKGVIDRLELSVKDCQLVNIRIPCSVNKHHIIAMK